MTTGIARPGEEYNITCTVEVIDRLIVTPTIVWIKDSINISLVSDDLNTISVPSVLTNITDTIYSLSLFFSSLNTSDAGQYTCQATITVNETNIAVTNNSVQDLFLQSKSKYAKFFYFFSDIVPQPVIAVSIYTVNTSTLVEGTYLDIICTVNISDAVNTAISIHIKWSHNSSSPLANNSDYTISSLTMLGSHMYTSTLRIESLSNTRDNDTIYTCTVSVRSSPAFSYITSNENNNSLKLIVTGIILNYTRSNSIIIN